MIRVIAVGPVSYTHLDVYKRQGMQNAGDMETMMDMAEKQILDVTRRRKTTDFKSSNEVVNEVIENIHKMSAQKSGVTGVATGYRDLDNTTNGFQRGDLIILAARPSMGKTAFALNVAMQIACLLYTSLPILSVRSWLRLRGSRARPLTLC